MKKADWEIANEKNRLEGKGPVPLFTMEIFFEDWKEKHVLHRWHIHNQSWPESRGVRESMITHGIFLEYSAGRGEIVFPWQIQRCLIDIQKNGWKEIIEGPGGYLTNK